MVMNILAEMMPSNVIGIFFALLIYIVGHIFNLVMGLLSAYVHDSRLQYIEFFGKFYEGGGVEFKPLSMNLKHIDKIEKVEI
jgi:V/A-type H+-transporting ATPase subunit I